MLKTISSIPTTREQFERFKSGQLAEEWYEKNPDLFDTDDIRVARTQAKFGLHFYEWLSALVIYQSTGWLSLIESYEFRIQTRKQEIIKKLLPRKVLDVIHLPYGNEKQAQCPDLLCFKPDLSDWYFCEVKGPTDEMRDVQLQYFKMLEDSSKKPIYVIELTSQ